jgi:hypothetical protein
MLGLNLSLMRKKSFGYPIFAPGTFDDIWTRYERGISTLYTSLRKIQLESGGPYTLAAGLEIEINGTWTSANGTLVAGDVIRVRATSSPDYYVEGVSGTVALAVTIGGVPCTFTLINMVEPILNAANWTYGDEWVYDAPMEI